MSARNIYKMPSSSYKDGEDGGDLDKCSVIIETVENGWVLEYTGEEFDAKYVFTDKQEMLQKLKELL